MNKLDAISPIDGRYRRKAKQFSQFFSERALMSYRISVESEYFIALSDMLDGSGFRVLTEMERKLLRNLHELSIEDAQIIKNIEVTGHRTLQPTNHDVKAIEYYMKEKLQKSSLNDCLEMIHFGLTSEDVNNISYACMLKDAMNEVLIPLLNEVIQGLYDYSLQWRNIPMLGRTHGQPASPTTLGKEIFVYYHRLKEQFIQLQQFEIRAKLNGATGNYNAHVSAYPDHDWVKFSSNFIQVFNKSQGVKLKPNLITTQIEPHDTYAELFDLLRRINMILIDFDQDVWRYISDDWLKQKPIDGEVGSSTMPHKVNPIDFENSEGNLGLANALLSHFSTKLPVSRLQRDLSDSTVERNFGVAIAHIAIGYQSLLKGLSKIAANEEKIIAELERHPEIIAEAIQTILRREGIKLPYEKLKILTRGKSLTMHDFEQFINELDISPSIKNELNALKPTNYIGLAKLLVR